MFADVVVSVPSRGLDRPFTYHVPEHFRPTVVPGTIVKVPFHRQTLTGYVVEVHEQAPDLPPDAIRDILAVEAPEDFWGQDLLRLAHWMNGFYGCLMLEALQVIVPEPVRASLGKPRRARGKVRVVTRGADAPVSHPLLSSGEGDGPQMRRLLEVLQAREMLPPAELLNLAHAGREALQRLKEEGLIRYRFVAEESLAAEEDPLRVRSAPGPGLGASASPPELAPAQRAAVEAILEKVQARRPAVLLLHGVTGSGKTEVYLHALQVVISQGRQGLVLVPEISLTPQAVARYKTRLGERIAVLHSALTDSERVDAWWSLKRGQMQVALGARSCVFAPVADPALIIVDEEHDSSYKQEQSPRYHARQVAIRRAIDSSAVVVLGSATPSLETYHWAREGRYTLIELPERVEGRPLPEVEVVDLRRRGQREPSGRGYASLGAVLRERMRETLARGEQVMLLMNRRGFASYLMCRDCGFILRCPRCDISLTFHAHPSRLLCHYCLYERTAPGLCPECRGVAVDHFGSGTQRVEEEILEAFPGVGLARMDRDTMLRMSDHRRILQQFERGEVQVLLGTQMIAKGHDFPGVTLVGVVLADMALNLPDFRAAERTFSLLVQVAGRAGRGAQAGRVVIQTYNPEHPAVMHAARQDYRTFFDEEMAFRKELFYPPYSHIVNIGVSGEDEGRVREAAGRLHDAVAEDARRLGAQIVGPAPCAIGRIHRKYRWHLAFKAATVQEIMPLVRIHLRNRPEAGLQITVDADPVSML